MHTTALLLALLGMTNINVLAYGLHGCLARSVYGPVLAQSIFRAKPVSFSSANGSVHKADASRKKLMQSAFSVPGS